MVDVIHCVSRHFQHFQIISLFRSVGCYCSQNCLCFQSFNFEHTWWRL